MNNITVQAQADIIEQVIAKGDLSKLTPDERNQYYLEVCKSLGMNPLTQPFGYITLNGRLTLYPKRDAADQLRKINKVSIQIISRDVSDGILTVHARATLPDGRKDEDFGAVAFPDTLRGEVRANMELKAVTKAKRRVTLSICGLGWLDETEIEDIPASAKRPAPPAPNVMLAHDARTGEIIDPPQEAPQGAADGPAPSDNSGKQSGGAGILDEAKIELHKAATRGMKALETEWATLHAEHKRQLKRYLDETVKPIAEEADQQGELLP